MEVAAQKFCANGIHETGLASVMEAAGLTQGGFYRHFESKDRVLAESLESASRALVDNMSRVAGDEAKGAGLDSLVAAYLSPEHRDNVAEGCPYAALSSELARGSEEVRQVATQGLAAVVDAIAMQTGDSSAASGRDDAMFILATMVGALSLARMVDNPAFSDALLKQARERLLSRKTTGKRGHAGKQSGIST